MPRPGDIYDHYTRGRFAVVGTGVDDASGRVNQERIAVRHVETGALRFYTLARFTAEVAVKDGDGWTRVARFRRVEG